MASLFAKQLAYPFDPLTPQKDHSMGHIRDNRYADLAGYTGCNLGYQGLTDLKVRIRKVASQSKGDGDLILVGNYSGEATQSRWAGRFAGMMLPVDLDSDGAQESAHSLKSTVMGWRVAPTVGL